MAQVIQESCQISELMGLTILSDLYSLRNSILNMDSSTNRSLPDNDVGIYECEVRLRFRIIEEQLTMTNKEELVETLVDAFAYGSDEYLEAIDSQVAIEQLQDVDQASPEMRRQLIRLRNSNRLT